MIRDQNPFLEKDLKLIQPRSLLTLGFHFVEHPGVVRKFGADLLKLVSKKFSTKDEGRIAKNKFSRTIWLNCARCTAN